MIRQASSNDLQEIVFVHTECFSQNFSTVFGKSKNCYLLKRLYEEYLLKVPELFLVSENEKGKIDGFCMRYYAEYNEYKKNFLKHNFFRIACRMTRLLLTGNKTAWQKLFALIKRKRKAAVDASDSLADAPLTEKGDLLSICVQPSRRGSGLAGQLIKEFENVLLNNGRKICLLSVQSKNARAISFYRKNGYSIYMHDPNESSVFVKKLERHA